ncbi:hypothetical protein ACQ4PT_048653 [Festuca glaucescens]
MAFGSKRTHVDDQNDDKVEETGGDRVDVDLGNTDSAEEEDDSAEHGIAAVKPLLDEVILLDARKKNSGGSRPWKCKHCDKKFTSSSYTRIHHHFFGPGPGKPPQISCCSVANDRVKYKKIYEKYHKAEKGEPSSSVATKTLAETFSRMERDAVDVQIMMFLCANGIPFNVLRSPQYYEMVAAI